MNYNFLSQCRKIYEVNNNFVSVSKILWGTPVYTQFFELREFFWSRYFCENILAGGILFYRHQNFIRGVLKLLVQDAVNYLISMTISILGILGLWVFWAWVFWDFGYSGFGYFGFGILSCHQSIDTF